MCRRADVREVIFSLLVAEPVLFTVKKKKNELIQHENVWNGPIIYCEELKWLLFSVSFLKWAYYVFGTLQTSRILSNHQRIKWYSKKYFHVLTQVTYHLNYHLFDVKTYDKLHLLQNPQGTRQVIWPSNSKFTWHIHYQYF